MGCQQIHRERPGRGKGGVKIVRSNFHRETRENHEQKKGMFIINLTAKGAKTANVLMAFSYPSFGSRFMIFNRRVHSNSNRETRENREKLL